MLSINRSTIFVEEIDDQAEKKGILYIQRACSLNLFMKFVYNNMKNYIPGMDCNIFELISTDIMEQVAQIWKIMIVLQFAT